MILKTTSSTFHSKVISFVHTVLSGAFTLSGLLLLGLGTHAKAQTLQVTFGSKGVQTLSYAGTILEDVGARPSDAFHIWHMRATDLQGNVLSSGQYVWGESNYGEVWNASTNTETYNFSWGAIATQFVQNGNNLDMIVTETNNAGSGVILDGAEIYPFALHFPKDPLGFSGYSQYAITTIEPGVSVADFGAGVVTSVIPNEAVPLYGGWKADGTNAYTPIMTGTAPDGLATFFPNNNAPVQPGASLTYTVSLRFTPEGTPATLTDAYASFAATYPSQMTWSDRRAIGTAYLASSPTDTGDITQPGGYPTNPRRYLNDASIDITTAAGLQVFQDRVLAQAANNVTNTLALNGQAVITWDIEGEQYPQSTSYVCSPDQIATLAPEMEIAIIDRSSAFYGQKLDDAYFKTMSNAGLKIGLCLRPQAFVLAPNGTASQITLASNTAIVANLETKARFANSRWGATIFYVDSTVDVNGGTLDPAIFQRLITDLPNFLFIPEESTPRYYAYTAPFYSFIFHTDLGTPVSTYSFYPNAFGANLINDVSASTLATYQPQLTSAVGRGDILMAHADYWQDNDPSIVAIYQAAGVTKPAPVATPVITWATPSAIAYGTALSGMQLNATANVPGSFVYSPAAGTLLSAGNKTLMVTFNPTDRTNYKSATATVILTVTPPQAALAWAAPAAFPYGTRLSTTQLNATANVPGSFVYKPSAGTLLSAGSSTLTVTFTPVDAINYKPVTATTSVTVNQAVPVLTWATPAAIPYGTALSRTQLKATASVAGRFTYSPATGKKLAAGQNTLSVSFKPTDTTNYSSTAASVILKVNVVAPKITFRVVNHYVNDAPFIVAATSNSAGASTYAVVSGPATISGSTVTITGVGRVVVHVAQVADGSFAAATQNCSFTVSSRTIH